MKGTTLRKDDLMRNRVLLFMSLVTLCALPATGQETGTLKARFVYAGEALPPKPIEVNKDKEFCGKHSLVDERLHF